jgi:hypothetical protein
VLEINDLYFKNEEVIFSALLILKKDSSLYFIPTT